MSKRVLVVVTVFALAAGAAGAYVAIRARLPDRTVAPRPRDLAPRGLAYFAEAKDLGSVWAKMRSTEAWKDLAASQFVATIAEEPGVKDLLDALENASKKLDYPLDGDNVMKLVGRDTAFGLSLPETGGPEMLLLTRIDVDALTKDLLARQADWRALMEELTKRSGRLDLQVTTSEHSTSRGKVSVARLEREGRDTFLALCGDTLVLSSDGAICRSVLDRWAADGSGGLGSDLRFRDEAAKISGTPALLEWFDLDLLSARRPVVAELLRARESTPPEALAAVDAVLAGVEGGGTVCRATDVPEGDLYGIEWRWSKGSEMFADKDSPALGEVLGGEWIATAEVRDLDRVVAAWERSAVRKRLVEGPIGKKIAELREDPSAAAGPAVAQVQAHLRNFMDPDQPLTESVDQLAEHVKDRFLLKMGERLVSRQLDAVFGDDFAGAADWSGRDGELPRLVGAVRLEVDGRLLALAMDGAVQEANKATLETTTHGGRRVRSLVRDVPGGLGFHWSLVGDALVLSNDLGTVRAAIDGAGGTGAPAGRRGEVAAKMRPGWCSFTHMDFERLRDAVGRMPDEEGMKEMLLGFLDSYLGMNSLPAHLGLATYVPDDFAHVELRQYSVMLPPAAGTPSILRADGDPAWRKSLPEGTFVYSAGFLAWKDLWQGLAKAFGTAGMDLSSAEEEFRKAFEMDLAGELLPALGEGCYLALTHQKARAPEAGPAGMPGPPPMAIPGIVVGISVRDEKVVGRFVDRTLELVRQTVRESQPDREGDIVVAGEHDGVPVHAARFTPEEEMQIPVRPALSLSDGWLVISTEAEVLKRVIDARHGRAAGFATSPSYSAVAADLSAKVAAESFLDWNRTLDQVKEMLPMFAAMNPAGSSVPFPEFPENGDEAEWERRMKKFQEDSARARDSGSAEAAVWVDALRVVDHLRSSSHVEGVVREDEVRVLFAK